MFRLQSRCVWSQGMKNHTVAAILKIVVSHAVRGAMLALLAGVHCTRVRTPTGSASTLGAVGRLMGPTNGMDMLQRVVLRTRYRAC